MTQEELDEFWEKMLKPLSRDYGYDSAIAICRYFGASADFYDEFAREV